MIISQESIQDGYEEYDNLVRDYFARTRAGEGIPPLGIDWTLLAELEMMQKFVLFSARERTLDGFVTYFVTWHPHHPSMLSAACDILAVRPEMRGLGVARQLISSAEWRLRQRGVTHMIHNFRVLYDTVPLFEKLGFELFEKSYIKELK